jgi:hypothetical protein
MYVFIISPVRDTVSALFILLDKFIWYCCKKEGKITWENEQMIRRRWIWNRNGDFTACGRGDDCLERSRWRAEEGELRSRPKEKLSRKTISVPSIVSQKVFAELDCSAKWKLCFHKKIPLQYKQEVMGRTNRLLSFDTTRTASKTRKLGGGLHRQPVKPGFSEERYTELYPRRPCCS